MQRLNHQNVVHCREPPSELRDLDGVADNLPLLCMEFCSGGDLRKILNLPQNCCGLESKQVLACAGDLASALGFLHNRRIIHRDLKPENVVLNNTDERVVYKLIDLGYAKELGQSSLALSFVGTLQYIAPELFLSQEYTKSVDYWSLGFLCFEIITGQRPFLPNLSPGQWMEHVQKKSHQDICIFQREDGEIFSMNTLFEENQLSLTLKRDFECWLRPLLEWNPKKRGRGRNGEICLFNELSSILSKTRVELVVMDNIIYKLDYVVEPEALGRNLCSWLGSYCGVASEELLLLTSDGTRLGEAQNLSSFLPCGQIFVFRNPVNASTSDLVKSTKLRLPENIQPFLQNPRQEIDFPSRKKVHAHALHFVRQEHACCLNLVKGVNVLFAYVSRRLKELDHSSHVIVKTSARVDAKFDFFQESLFHDLDKYRQQTQKKDHITSNQMFESWILSEQELKSQACSLGARMSEMSKRLSEVRLLPTPNQNDDDLGEFVGKTVRLVESLRRIPLEGRQEKENVFGVVQTLVKVLKKRDRILHEIFDRRIALAQVLEAADGLAWMQQTLLRDFESFEGTLSRMQRRRQSDVWKLLAAAVQQKGVSQQHHPQPQRPQQPTGPGESLVEENRELMRRFQEELRLAENAMGS